MVPDIFVSNPITPHLSGVSTDSLKPKTEKTVTNKHQSTLFSQAFSSFHFMPESVRFQTQAPGETIILLLRKHWLTNAFWLFISLVLISIPLFFYPLLATVVLPSFVTPSLVVFIFLIWYLIAFSYMLVNFLLWYFTVSIVTNERIIDIDYTNILYKNFSETRISKLEDVTEKSGGFVKSFFDYGDVYVQTAAKEAEFEFIEVPHPQRVVQIINDLMGKVEE